MVHHIHLDVRRLRAQYLDLTLIGTAAVLTWPDLLNILVLAHGVPGQHLSPNPGRLPLSEVGAGVLVSTPTLSHHEAVQSRRIAPEELAQESPQIRIVSSTLIPCSWLKPASLFLKVVC